MGEVDKVLNEYMKDNARFADFHNLVTFGGRKVLKPDLLEEMDTRVYAKLKNKAVGKEAHFGGQRDLKRRQKIGARFLVTAIEEQSEIHKAMPIRNNLYDAAEYNREYMQIKRNHKEKKDLTGADFIAGFGSEDRITPVITTILYTGEQPWTENLDLISLMHIEEFPKEVQKVLKENLNNYRIRLVDIHQIENYEQFETDLRLLVGYLKVCQEKENLLQFIRDNEEEFATIEEDTYDAIVALSGNEELKENKEKYQKKERGGVNMCKGLEDLINDSKAEGKAEGKAETIIKLCRKFGKTERETIEELMEELQLDEEKVKEYYNKYTENMLV